MTLQTQTNTVARIFAALAIAGMVALAGCLGGGGGDDVTPAPAPAPEPAPAPAPEPDPAPAPEPGPGRMTITPPASQTIENACADSGSITYTFFRVSSGQVTGYWPGGSLAPGQKAEIRTLENCTSGQQACYGAEPAGSGWWGVGLDGANLRECDKCCVACSSAGEARFSSVSLTCQAAGQPDNRGSPTNRSPAMRGTVPPQTLQVGQSVTLDLSGYFSDPDGDELTYSRLLDAGPVIVTATVSGNTLRIEGVRAGNATVRAVARDPAGRNEHQDIDVTVGTDNEGLKKRGSIPAQTLRVGGSVTLDLSRYFTDPDGDRLTYSLTFSGGRPNQVRASVSVNTLRIQGAVAGRQNIVVNARDPDGGHAYQQVQVTVEANNRYGAMAFSEEGRGGYSWAMSYGNSQSDAERAAVNRCTSLGGTRCAVVTDDRGGRLSGPDRCFAIARSEAPDAGLLPAFGFATGGTKAAADRSAIAQCERGVGTRQLSGTCRLDTSRDGSPGSVCYGTAAQ